jgi:hypothetical protein
MEMPGNARIGVEPTKLTKPKALKSESTLNQNAIHSEESELVLVPWKQARSSKSPHLSFHVASLMNCPFSLPCFFSFQGRADRSCASGFASADLGIKITSDLNRWDFLARRDRYSPSRRT